MMLLYTIHNVIIYIMINVCKTYQTTLFVENYTVFDTHEFHLAFKL